MLILWLICCDFVNQVPTPFSICLCSAFRKVLASELSEREEQVMKVGRMPIFSFLLLSCE